MNAVYVTQSVPESECFQLLDSALILLVTDRRHRLSKGTALKWAFHPFVNLDFLSVLSAPAAVSPSTKQSFTSFDRCCCLYLLDI